MKKVVVLSGAGISAESGIKTFRDAGGLWEGHDVMEVASTEGWRKNPHLVLDFYNQRRKQLKEVLPNKAHLDIQKLEEDLEVIIITQNVDDLHERAGSKNIIHLHGELLKVRSIKNSTLISVTTEDIFWGDTASDGAQLRPHIVWFGEEVPMIEKAIENIIDADFVLIIGTSMQVYPAAGLIHYLKNGCIVYAIDPNLEIHQINVKNEFHLIKDTAVNGVAKAIRMIKSTL